MIRLISLSVLTALLLAGCAGQNSSSVPETQAEGQNAPQLSVSEGQEYVKREGLQTILFMGLDKFEAPEDAFGYLNDQQCDFLMLFVLDEENHVCDVLHLNRDTMTEIRRLGVGGGEAGKFVGQLALAHTYGSGGSDSCLNACKAVSTLLKGVKIDHYIALTMAGVAKINDLVGGVEVEIPVDMTSVDPSFKMGEKVLLQGDQALLFVRARHGVGDQSNLSRMERQRIYMTEFYKKALFSSEEDSGFMKHSLLELTSDMKSDLSINQLDALGHVLEECTLNPFVTIDGEAKVGEFMEFYVDEDSLNDVLISLFTE